MNNEKYEAIASTIGNAGAQGDVRTLIAIASEQLAENNNNQIRIDEIVRTHEIVEQRWARQSQEKKEAVEAIIDGLLNLYPDVENQPDAIKDLAELFDIDLNTEFEVTIKLHYNLTISAPRGTSGDAIREAIEWREAEFSLNTDDFEKTSYNDGCDDYGISVSEQ
jgi:hypothetical protein